MHCFWNHYRECARLLLLVDDPTRDNYWMNILKKPYTPKGKSLPTTPFRELVIQKHMLSEYYAIIHQTVMHAYQVAEFRFPLCIYASCETIEVAEVVLHNCTKMDHYFVNKHDFTLECCYDFVNNESGNLPSPALMEHPILLMVGPLSPASCMMA